MTNKKSRLVTRATAALDALMLNGVNGRILAYALQAAAAVIKAATVSSRILVTTAGRLCKVWLRNLRNVTTGPVRMEPCLVVSPNGKPGALVRAVAMVFTSARGRSPNTPAIMERHALAVSARLGHVTFKYVRFSKLRLIAN